MTLLGACGGTDGTDGTDAGSALLKNIVIFCFRSALEAGFDNILIFSPLFKRVLAASTPSLQRGARPGLRAIFLFVFRKRAIW